MPPAPRGRRRRRRRRPRAAPPAATLRATPITSPNAPARPAATPASASSTTTARAGGTPRRPEAARKPSGAGLPRRPRRRMSWPSTVSSKRSSMPAARRTSSPLALEVTTAVSTPRRRSCLDPGDRAGEGVDAVAGERVLDERLLAVADAVHGPLVRRAVRAALGRLDAAGAQEVAHAVVARLAVEQRDVVALEVEGRLRRARAGAPLGEHAVERLAPARLVQRGGRGEHAVEVEQDGVVAVGGEGGAGHGKSIRIAGRRRERARSSVDVRDPARRGGRETPHARRAPRSPRGRFAAARWRHDLEPLPPRADRPPRTPAAVGRARARHRPPARPRLLRAGDTSVLGVLAILALPLAYAWAQPRLTRPTRIAVGVVIGLLALGFGVTSHGLHVVNSGARLARRHRRRLHPRRAPARGVRPHRRRRPAPRAAPARRSAGAPSTASAGSPARPSRSSSIAMGFGSPNLLTHAPRWEIRESALGIPHEEIRDRHRLTAASCRPGTSPRATAPRCW